MRTNTLKIMGLVLGGLLFLSPEAKAISPETQLLLDLLQAKGVISAADAQSFKQTIEDRMPTGDAGNSAQGLAQRVEDLEKAGTEGALFGGKVQAGGVIEINAAHTSTKPAGGGPSNNENDLTLATVELGIDVDIAPHVSGHLVLLFEEDEDADRLRVDTGYISLFGADKNPFYLNAGKMAVPFGRYETHFISDPVTLTLGETAETALVAGYSNDVLDLSLGVFNGDIQEATSGNNINTFAASAVVAGALSPDLAVTAGVSYISNLADSDTMQDEVTGVPSTVTSLVGGFSAFVSASFQDKFFLDAEYVGATDDFLAGEVAYSAAARSPSAWNFELGYAVAPDLEVALRYGGSDDFDNMAPEKQYGVALSYGLFEQTTLAIEYLRGDMTNNDDVDTVTVQLAIEY